MIICQNNIVILEQALVPQHCLLVLIQTCKEISDKMGSFWALQTDPSKAFDCILHDLLIAKLHVYGFDMTSLKSVTSYLSNRKHS